MEKIKIQIAKDLLKIKAVFFRPEEPFTWASGIKSPVYCDNRLTLTAPEAVFYTTNATDGEKTKTLTLSLADADMASDNVVEAYIMTSMLEASVAAETELTLTVVSNLGTWSKKFTPGAFTLKAGMRNVITLNDKDWTVAEGDGSQANPYIIRTVSDLTGMAEKLAAEKKYFAMVNDIDMASVTSWIKIENGTPIDFNGNNRTITNFKPTTCASSYYGFIGVLNGKVSNISFVDANITSPNNSACGIVCGYLGQANGNSRGDLENIHVRGSVLGNSNGVGGLVGYAGAINITNSFVQNINLNIKRMLKNK